MHRKKKENKSGELQFVKRLIFTNM